MNYLKLFLGSPIIFYLFLYMAYSKKLPFQIKGELPTSILRQIESTYTNETPYEVSKVISNIPTFKAIYAPRENTIYVVRSYYIRKIKIVKIPKDFDKNFLMFFLILQKYTSYDEQKKFFLKAYIKEILQTFNYKVRKILIKEKYNNKAVDLYIYIYADKIKEKNKKIFNFPEFKKVLKFFKNLIKEKPKVKKRKISKGKENRKIGLIIFYGLDRTNIDSFKGAILIRPNQSFSEKKLLKIINILYSSGYFFSIRVKKVYTKNKVNLIFDVRDAPRYKIKSYVGYNLLYGPVFDFNIKAISPFKAGNIYSLSLKYQKNRLFDINIGKEKNFLAFQAEYKWEKVSNVTSKTFSIYGKKKFFSLYNIFSPEVGLSYKYIPSQNFSRIYTYLAFRFKRKNVDSNIFPTQGYILETYTRYMFSLDFYYNLLKVMPKFIIFLPIKQQIFTYKLSLTSGWLENFSKTQDITEYFYLGGFNTLRGFDYKTIGPAKYFLNFQNDILYRIRDKIFMGPFLDLAVANIEKNKLYSSCGLEIGIITPLGNILVLGSYKIKEDNVKFKSLKDRISWTFLVGLSF